MKRFNFDGQFRRISRTQSRAGLCHGEKNTFIYIALIFLSENIEQRTGTKLNVAEQNQNELRFMPVTIPYHSAIE